MTIRPAPVVPQLLLGLALAAPVAADDPRDGIAVVDAEKFIQLAAETPELVMIDSRVPADRGYGYIEGSQSLPDTSTDCTSLARMAPSPDTPIAFYCNGVRCGRSERAARIARGCGFTNIYWLKGGFEEWTAKGYTYLQD